MAERFGTHPYIPNSAPENKEAMLKAIGVEDIEAFYACIPRELRLAEDGMELPAPLPGEAALQRHMQRLMGQNGSCSEYINFLGAGCYQCHVPAVCDEIAQRSEFLTAYAGEPYEDHGRFQALFEYTSMMAEMLDMDVVNVPTYDGSQAAATSLRMASRITGRFRVLVAETVHPDKVRMIRNYCSPQIAVEPIPYNERTGHLDLAALEEQLADDVAAVLFDNPTFHGVVEPQGKRVAEMVHAVGGLLIVAVDPSSLGVLQPPSRYGADMACGDVQPLGMHMLYGGARGGFIATPDDPAFVQEYPSRLFGIAPTTHGEWGFGDVAWERTSLAVREKGKEFVGTAAALWGITAGAYLALMGPQGMQDLGKGILQRSRYLAAKLGELDGVRAPSLEGSFFREFVVNFDDTGRKVGEINAFLRGKGIFGGYDLSEQYPALGRSALYCVTEATTQEDMDTLVAVLKDYLA
ncbi:MAG: aminomethyl-transferring glycine dehydrogenase subunit GcvPA [Synergistales bacterium]|nr:aminomethyl-transferring glycine dehydrogenase subunit GcvPA [Synergistales bacterium]